MERYYNKATIIKFYSILKFSGFRTITPERQKELDEIVSLWAGYFKVNSIGLQSLMTLTAEKLITSSKNFGLRNGDEMAYFYIKVVDPNFLFLEVYEAANMVNEIKEFSMKNFGLCDKTLIYLERLYNKHFKEFGPDDLWSRDMIKR